MQNSQIKAYAVLALAITIFTGQGLVLKTILSTPDGYDGIQLSVMRQSLAVIFMAPIAGMIAWKNRHALWQNRLFVLKGAVIGMCLHSLSSTIGLQYTSALNNYIFQAMVPIFAVMLGMMFYKQTVSKYTLFYIVLSIIGVLIIVTKGHLETLTTLQLNIGDIFVIASCLIWAYYGFLMRRKPENIEFVSFIFVGLTLSAMMGAGINYAIGDSNFSKDVWTPEFYALMFYAVIMGQIISLFAYTYAASILDSIIPATCVNAVPPLGAVLSVWILGETFHDYHALGILLIGISVYKIVMRDIRKSKEQKIQP